MFFLFAAMAEAATDAQLAAISSIGELNGAALQCGYVQQVQHIKRTLVRVLPRKRELGVWFEHSTNDAFLEFMQQQKTCPAQETFSAQLEQAIAELEAAFQ